MRVIRSLLALTLATLGACSSADHANAIEDTSGAVGTDPGGGRGGSAGVGGAGSSGGAGSGGTDPATCAPADEATVPIPPLTGPNYVIKLEGPKLSRYAGLVRADAFYTTQAPVMADILVCSGDYENPNIKVSESNHHYSWSYTDPKDAPKTGAIVNIHAVPTTPALHDLIETHIKLQKRVRIWGFEVDRVDYSDGSWWTDEGCNTLLITHVCIDE